MTKNNDGISFYFFDFDDNVMVLDTTIILNTNKNGEEKLREFSTIEFAKIYPQLGKPGEFENYAMVDDSYRNFRDIPKEELKPGQKQNFVLDVEKAINKRENRWQAPSWKLFVYACEKRRPISIVTARGHSLETLKAGIRVLVEKGLISQEPDYLTIFPVGNDDIRRTQLDDPALTKSTSKLKEIAIIKSVDKAIEQYGSDPKHRFGMSDDDLQNVDLIIKAMRDCKSKYEDKRFFVINTNHCKKVKLEVFPIYFPATDDPEFESLELLD